MVEDGHGRCHGRFTVSSLHGAMLRKQLLAIAAPKHRARVDGQAPEPGRPSAHRLGEAFAEYIETYPTDRLPHSGGVSATVVVTMGVETLMGGLKAAELDTGHRISPGLARRLACRAGIIPAVLGTRSQVLDLGRRTRFHTEPQRIALAIEQGGCTAEGCDWPPGMCHAHHDQPFSTGGDTTVKNGRLLCPRHHARAHDPAYDDHQAPRREGQVPPEDVRTTTRIACRHQPLRRSHPSAPVSSRRDRASRACLRSRVGPPAGLSRPMTPTSSRRLGFREVLGAPFSVAPSTGLEPLS